jgi:hypothetical protein
VPENGNASLRLYNTIGQEVATIYDEVAKAGQYVLVRFDASSLNSGVYFYSLQFGNQRLVKRLVLMK